MTRRALATLIDVGLAVILAGLLATTTGVYFAERATVAFAVYSPNSVWNGPIPMLLGMVSRLSYGFSFAWLALMLSEGLFGVSVGKMIVNRHIVALESNEPSRRKLMTRYLIKYAPHLVFCLALLVGRWQLLVVVAFVACASGIDFLVATIRRRPATHDRLAQTYVTERSPRLDF